MKIYGTIGECGAYCFKPQLPAAATYHYALFEWQCVENCMALSISAKFSLQNEYKNHALLLIGLKSGAFAFVFAANKSSILILIEKILIR